MINADKQVAAKPVAMPFYGEETRKALELWGGAADGGTPHELVYAYAEVKLAAIRAQQAYAQIYSPEYFALLERACYEVMAGQHSISFPLPLSQGGAGTSLHMNICEVLAGLGNYYAAEAGLSERSHPLDDLARYQSTNDTLATALSIIALRGLREVTSGVVAMQEALNHKELAYQNLLMVGRSELQDALPIMLGQVFGAWAGMLERDRWRLHKVQERIRYIALGGTAIGTSFSAPARYVFLAEAQLREITGLPLARSQNLPDAIAHKDDIGELAANYQLLGANLRKLCGDLLLYSSSLSGELSHPELQYGSSIMPSKINPVLLEYASGLSISAQHEAQRIIEYTQMGQLQLNAYVPFMIEALLRCQEALYRAMQALSQRFLSQLLCNEQRIEERLISSPALLNTLRGLCPYSKIKALLPEYNERRGSFESREELANWLAGKLDLDAEEILRYFSNAAIH